MRQLRVRRQLRHTFFLLESVASLFFLFALGAVSLFINGIVYCLFYAERALAYALRQRPGLEPTGTAVRGWRLATLSSTAQDGWTRADGTMKLSILVRGLLK